VVGPTILVSATIPVIAAVALCEPRIITTDARNGTAGETAQGVVNAAFRARATTIEAPEFVYAWARSGALRLCAAVVRTTDVLTGTAAVMAAVTTGVPFVLTANAGELIAYRSTPGVISPALGSGAHVIDTLEVAGAVCGFGTLGLLAVLVVVAVLRSRAVPIATTSTSGVPDIITAHAGCGLAPSITQDATCGTFVGRALTIDTSEAAHTDLTIVDIAITVIVDTVALLGRYLLVGDVNEKPDLERAGPTVESPHAGVDRAGTHPLVLGSEGKTKHDLIIHESARGQGDFERLFLPPGIAHRAAAYGDLFGHALQCVTIIAEPVDLHSICRDDDLFFLHSTVGGGIV